MIYRIYLWVQWVWRWLVRPSLAWNVLPYLFGTGKCEPSSCAHCTFFLCHWDMPNQTPLITLMHQDWQSRAGTSHVAMSVPKSFKHDLKVILLLLFLPSDNILTQAQFSKEQLFWQVAFIEYLCCTSDKEVFRGSALHYFRISCIKRTWLMQRQWTVRSPAP